MSKTAGKYFRKMISGFVVLMAAFTVFFASGNAAAASMYKAVEGTAGAGNITISDEIQIAVNSVKVEFPDAKPFVDSNSRTLIPVRFVTEAMGATVSWDQDSWTAVIEKDGIKIEIAIGEKDVKVTQKGETTIVSMDTVAVIKEGRTFVPIRFVAETLGAFVGYSDLYNLADIVMPEEVTAKEIERLRSYDMVKYRTVLRDSKYWESEYDHFEGKNWFANSHYYLVTLDAQRSHDVKSFYAKTKVLKDANALDYTIFAVQCAEEEIETPSWVLELESVGKTYYLPGMWSNGDASVSFRTDNSLAYQMQYLPQAYVSVRGIMDYTAKTERGAKILNVQFGIAEPEIGKQYSFDTELIMQVDGYRYMDLLAAFRFDENGLPVEIEPYTEKS